MANQPEVLDREDLPEPVQTRLENLLQKEPRTLNSSQRRYMKARRAYLTLEEREIYSDVINAQVQQNEEQTIETADSASEQERDGEKLPDREESEETASEKDEEEVEVSEGSDYEDWSRDQLFAEVDRRNEGRDKDDQISKGGTNEDVAERLHEDDEA